MAVFPTRRGKVWLAIRQSPLWIRSLLLLRPHPVCHIFCEGTWLSLLNEYALDIMSIMLECMAHGSGLTGLDLTLSLLLRSC